MPALIRDGYTSFKVYMTYDDLKLDDRQMLDMLALARRENALPMIHAESSDIIGWLTDKLELRGFDGTPLSCQFPADGGRTGSDAPGHQSQRDRRGASSDRPCLGP